MPATAEAYLRTEEGTEGFLLAQTEGGGVDGGMNGGQEKECGLCGRRHTGAGQESDRRVLPERRGRGLMYTMLEESYVTSKGRRWQTFTKGVFSSHCPASTQCLRPLLIVSSFIWLDFTLEDAKTSISFSNIHTACELFVTFLSINV